MAEYIDKKALIEGMVKVDGRRWSTKTRRKERRMRLLIDKANLMRHIENEMREWGEEYDALQILGDIEDFPTVDPVRHGLWIDLQAGGNVYCTECGEQFEWRTNYCPECGSKMRGFDDEDYD